MTKNEIILVCFLSITVIIAITCAGWIKSQQRGYIHNEQKLGAL